MDPTGRQLKGVVLSLSSMTNKQSPASLPRYLTPPVNEVACGCQFQPLSLLKIPHWGLFWQKLGKSFPTVEHAAPIQTGGSLLVDDATGLPLPRVWFINEDESRLVQLQADRLHYNWRHREKEPKYPHYDEIVDRFFESFTTLESFAAEASIGVIQPIACELTYINHIPQGSGWQAIDDLPKMFRDFLWTAKERYLPSPTSEAWHVVFPLPNGQGRLTAKLNQGSRKPDDAKVLIFELTARGIGDDRSQGGMRRWFDMAHEHIVKGFADLTTEEAQINLWKRQ